MPHPSHDPAVLALSALGWDGAFADRFAPHAATGGRPGRVARVDRGGQLLLLTAGGPVRARTTQRLAGAADASARPTVGDWVAVRDPPDDSLPTVDAVLPRRTAFLRHASDDRRVAAQVLAANVEVALVVASVARDVNLRRLERFLALAWSSGAVPVVVGSKVDECRSPAEARAAIARVALGADVHLVSAHSGEGVDGIAALLAAGRTAVLLGASGVGKSTLVNRLLGSDALATRAVRNDGKGRHTTTSRELVVLPAGGAVIDTPGLRALGLWNADDGVDQAFTDVEALAAACRFRDCAHQREPGCAVRGAVADGTLGADRLAAYDKLQRELAHLARKQDRALRDADTRRWKSIHKAMRDHPKLRDR